MSKQARDPGALAWAVVGLSFLALGLIFALRNTVGLLMPVWETDPGWSRTLVSGGGAVILTLMGVGAPIGGSLLDRWGPRPVYVAGMVLVAAAAISTAQVSAGWAFLVLYCGISGLGTGALNLPSASATVARYFTRRRGLATGVALAGASGGQLLLMPLAAILVGAFGWRDTYVMAGGALLVLALAAAILLRRAPASADTSGGRGAAASGPARSNGGVRGTARFGRLRYLFGSRTFLLLLAAFAICGFTTAGAVEVHFLPYAAACGFPPLESTMAYGVLGVANMVGVILFGWWADRAPPRSLLAGMFFARAGSFLILMQVAGDLPLLIVFAVLFGLLNFATLPVVATIVGRHFGLGIMGLSLGLLFGGHSLGAAAGAFMGGWLFDLFARYEAVWYLTFALALVAGLLTLMIRPPERDPSGAVPAAA